MSTNGFHVVTGAYGYSGKYIAQRLLDAGCEVRTLTNSPNRPDPFGGRVPALPMDFDSVEELTDSLRGASVLYNTYWVRYNAAGDSHEVAVRNTLQLFEAAKQAGVGRIVHVSILNPSDDSPFPYFRGKAQLERALGATGIPHSILRPAILFGKEDILVNNIAWSLRRLPVFGVFGNGRYRIQPVYVDDLAALAVEHGRLEGNHLINATGPEVFVYKDLVKTVADIIGVRRLVMSVPAPMGYLFVSLLGKLVGDVIITRTEMQSLMNDLLWADTPPTAPTKLTDWAKENRETLGVKYASELARRLDRTRAYD